MLHGTDLLKIREKYVKYRKEVEANINNDGDYIDLSKVPRPSDAGSFYHPAFNPEM